MMNDEDVVTERPSLEHVIRLNPLFSSPYLLHYSTAFQRHTVNKKNLLRSSGYQSWYQDPRTLAEMLRGGVEEGTRGSRSVSLASRVATTFSLLSRFCVCACCFWEFYCSLSLLASLATVATLVSLCCLHVIYFLSLFFEEQVFLLASDPATYEVRIIHKPEEVITH
jgi:hypothetical protein